MQVCHDTCLDPVPLFDFDIKSCKFKFQPNPNVRIKLDAYTAL